MKKPYRVFALLLAVCLLAGPAVPARATPPMPAERLTVLFTHDTHDHFYPDANDMGGYTRLAAAIKSERAASPWPTVTLDAGDFSMGSLFQTIYTTQAPELRALGAMGYDVTTLGNHEFDYRQQGLADMLSAAKRAQWAEVQWAQGVDIASGGQMALPAIVQANYTTPDGGDAPVALAKAFENYPVTDYTIIQRDGIKVAVFGVMGVDSDECAPMSGMTYQPMVEAARRVVAEIEEKERPTFIICLSHGGTEKGKGEDYELARAVDGIDLIISGHTHTTLTQPIVVNNTPIVSCGSYTQNLGAITLSSNGGYSDYKLIPIDSSIPPDPDMLKLAGRFKELVDLSYLSQYGMTYDGVLTTASSDFTIPETGNLVGEAYIDAVRKLEGEDYRPIAFAVAPSGVIRGRLAAGGVTTAQAFDILSLGSGADGSPGYPLVSVYLTGEDMKNVFEVDASISGLMPAAQLFGAGSWWHYNPNRMFLDRVTECQASDGYGGTAGPFAKQKLYRVVADLYSGQMLAAVKEKSFGLLSITPRDKNGQPITDFEEHILHDAQGRELKAWQAFATYLAKQDTVSPEPVEITKEAQPSWNPIKLLIPMGMPTLVVLLVVLLLIALVVFIVYRIRTRKARKARKAAKRAAKGKQ